MNGANHERNIDDPARQRCHRQFRVHNNGKLSTPNSRIRRLRLIVTSGKFLEQAFGLGVNSGPCIRPKSLNSCVIASVLQRRGTETRLYGGEGGIRTLDTGLPYTHFPGVLLQPLGHLSGESRRARVNQNPASFKSGKPGFSVDLDDGMQGSVLNGVHVDRS